MTTANDLELEVRADLVADENVHDDTETDDIAETVRYRITSYGADFDVEGLVRRMRRGTIFVPDFQRGFVWTQPQASLFIESLLLDLPVPGIFLAQDPQTEKLMVIDGQQRLKTLQFFYSGVFRENEPHEGRPRPFVLRGVNHPEFEKMKYSDLRERDQNRLDNSLLHATIIRQNAPEEGSSNIFHIFRRLNTGGEQLTPQEIRWAIYQGQLMDSVRELNANPDWRAVYGPENARQKDQEMVLRFWAMYQNAENYSAPMLGFLNKFVEEHRNPSIEFLYEGRSLFAASIKAFNVALGGKAFRVRNGRQLNAAVFDSMMVGLANRISRERGDAPDASKITAVHNALLTDEGYLASVSGGTAQAASVNNRMKKSIHAFGEA